MLLASLGAGCTAGRANLNIVKEILDLRVLRIALV